MENVLVAYGTAEGQTAKICEYIAQIAKDRGHNAKVVNASEQGGVASLEDYEAVIVGASIYMGEHGEYVRDFVRRNVEELDRVPSAFFSVNLTATNVTEQAREEIEGYVGKFEEETGRHPDMVCIFAGALLYTQFGFIKRRMMKRITREMGNEDTDTSRDYEYTDWNEVKGFTEEFLKQLALEGTRSSRERR